MASPIFTAWNCGTTPLVQIVELTYDGQTFSSSASLRSQRTNPTSMATTPTSSSSAAAASTTGSSSGSGGGSSSSAVPVGVIAGATVGGVLGLAGLIALVVLAVCCTRRRARLNEPAPPPEPQGPIPEFHGPIAEFHGPMAEQAMGDHKMPPSPLESGPTSPSVSTAMGSPAMGSSKWGSQGLVGMQSMGVSEVEGYGHDPHHRPTSDAGQSELAASQYSGRPHGS